jgi:hypothetical protein
VPDLLRHDGLEAFDETARRHVASGGVPGIVALVASGDQVHVATAGALSIGGSPVARDSMFRIASVRSRAVIARSARTVSSSGASMERRTRRSASSGTPPQVHVDLQTAAYGALVGSHT